MRGEEGGVPQWATLSNLYAIREWLKPHMEGLHNLRLYYHFAVCREADSTVTLHYKQWNSEAWDAEKYPPLKPLLSLPTGVPHILKPDYTAVDLDRLESMVTKASDIGALNENDVKEWKTFLEEEKQKRMQYETAEVVEVQQKGDRRRTHFH